MRSFTIWFLFIISLIYEGHSEELCGLEPPKAGESCGGADGVETTEEDSYAINIVWNSAENVTEDDDIQKIIKYEYEEKPLTPEEVEAWDRRFYPKRMYTNQYDWPIKYLLDAAENHMADNYDKAIEEFEKILKDYPESIRGRYFKMRAEEMKLANDTKDHTSEEYLKEINKLLDKYQEFVEKYEDPDPALELDDKKEIMPPLFKSNYFHVIGHCENFGLINRQIEFTEIGLMKNSDINGTFRFHMIHIQNHFLIGDLDGAKKTIDRAFEQFPDLPALVFFRGLHLKASGEKKEGNKLLRSIDFESADFTEIAHDMNAFGNNLIKAGKESIARMLFQEGSKIHMFMSSYQRPAIRSDIDVESAMIWNMEDNIGLTSYDEELTELTDFFPTLKEEALKVLPDGDFENITEYWQTHKAGPNSYIHSSEGSFHNLPLYAYGKRRRLNCLNVAPETCKFIKQFFPRAAKMHYGAVKLTVIDPKTKTLPVECLTSLRLKILMPIQIPEKFQMTLGKDTEVSLVEGQWTVIDDTFERVYNNENGDKAAIWLSLDIPHPDLSEQQTKGVAISAYAKNLFLHF